MVASSLSRSCTLRALGLAAAAVTSATESAATPEDGLCRAHVAAASAYLRVLDAGTARTWLEEAPVAPRHWEWRQLAAASDLALRTLAGHAGGVAAIAYSPDGTRLASAGADGTVRLWDARSGALLRELPGHEAQVLAVAFDPAGKRLASSSRDTTIRVWSLESNAPKQVLRGHTQPVGSVDGSRDGTRLASGSYARSKERPVYGLIRIWDTATGTTVREITSDQYAPITSVRFASDGKRLLAGSWDQTVRVYDLEAPDRDPVVRSLTPEEGYRAVNSVAWSPDGAAMPIRSAEISLTAHRVEAGHVSGVTSSSVGTEIDAMLAFPVGRHLTMTLAASHFRGGRFYREATGSEPSVNYAYAGFEFRF